MSLGAAEPGRILFARRRSTELLGRQAEVGRLLRPESRGESERASLGKSRGNVGLLDHEPRARGPGPGLLAEVGERLDEDRLSCR